MIYKKKNGGHRAFKRVKSLRCSQSDCLFTLSLIGHFAKHHNTLCLSPKFWISIVFVFSWGHCKSQEKLETMLMQNLGGQTKQYYRIFRSGLLRDMTIA